SRLEMEAATAQQNSDPERHSQPDVDDESPHSSEPENDDSRDWEETGEPQSGLNPLQNNKVLAIDVKTGKTKFSCSVCRKRFSWKNSLVAHMKRHSEGKYFSCSVFCSKTFPNHSNLRRHLTLHTGEKQFSCPVCSKKFAQRGHLKQHLAVHTGEKPFSCSVCSKTFTHNNLKRHLTLHNGERPFKCSVCSKMFPNHSYLRRHLQYVEKHKCVGKSSRKK
uniref:C2H2-type domain-containing protein n=1 Tax=Sander lucioperca TaxID=283035 RepID=A0A8D0CPY4_SANLU